MPKKSFATLANHLQEVMVDSLPNMVKKHVKEQVQKQVPEQVQDQVPVYVAKGLILERQKNKEEMEKMIAKAILQERKNIHAQISLKIQKAIANDIPSQVDASSLGSRFFYLRALFEVFSSTPVLAPGCPALPSKMAHLVAIEALRFDLSKPATSVPRMVIFFPVFFHNLSVLILSRAIFHLMSISSMSSSLI
nr:hypothetical protein [Tanacetum cinerariifolium]